MLCFRSRFCADGHTGLWHSPKVGIGAHFAALGQAPDFRIPVADRHRAGGSVAILRKIGCRLRCVRPAVPDSHDA